MAGISGACLVFVAFFALLFRPEKKKRSSGLLTFNLFRQYCFSIRGQSQNNLMPYFIYTTDPGMSGFN